MHSRGQCKLHRLHVQNLKSNNNPGVDTRHNMVSTIR
jgi:hypothetical protein